MTRQCLSENPPSISLPRHIRELIAKRVREAPESMQELIREQFLRLDGTSIDVDVMTKPSMWKGRPAAYVTFRDITAQTPCGRGPDARAGGIPHAHRGRSDQVFGVGISDGGVLYSEDSGLPYTPGYSREDLQAMTSSARPGRHPGGRWQNCLYTGNRQEGTYPGLYDIPSPIKTGAISDTGNYGACM